MNTRDPALVSLAHLEVDVARGTRHRPQGLDRRPEIAGAAVP